MAQTDKKGKRVKIAPGEYVSYGKGVSTRELISDPSANETMWSTFDSQDDDFDDIDEGYSSYTPSLRFNLISSSLEDRKEKYLKSNKIPPNALADTSCNNMQEIR